MIVTFVIIACVEKWQDPIAKVSIRSMPRVVALVAKAKDHSWVEEDDQSSEFNTLNNASSPTRKRMREVDEFDNL